MTKEQELRNVAIEAVILALKQLDCDGETMEHILNQTGLSDQIFRQLVLKADEEVLNQLVQERDEVNPPLSPKEHFIAKLVADITNSLKRNATTKRSTCSDFNWDRNEFMYMPEVAERLKLLGYTVIHEVNHGVDDWFFGGK